MCFYDLGFYDKCIIKLQSWNFELFLSWSTFNHTIYSNLKVYFKLYLLRINKCEWQDSWKFTDLEKQSLFASCMHMLTKLCNPVFLKWKKNMFWIVQKKGTIYQFVLEHLNEKYALWCLPSKLVLYNIFLYSSSLY